MATTLTIRIMRVVASLLAVPLAACGTMAPIGGAGDRIVSIDYCADQAVLDLVSTERIVALSTETEPAARASALPRHVRAEAEAILALRPTLVVRSYAGGPRLEAALERAGVRTFTVPYASALEDVTPNLLATGAALGANGRAQSLARDWQAALHRASAAPRRSGKALYLTPGDVTTGPDSFIAQIIMTAGYRIYDGRPGWNRLPVEAMAVDPPTRIIRAFFDAPRYQQDRWSAAGHAVVAEQMATAPQVNLTGAEVACNNWRSGAALDRLAAQTATSQ